jgi:hypothetical protein
MTELKVCDCCGAWLPEHRVIASARKCVDTFAPVDDKVTYMGATLDEFNSEQLAKICSRLIKTQCCSA